MDNVTQDLNNIISNREIKTVFQPIISLRDGEVLGHEALSRITCVTNIKNIEELFILAGKYNCLWELEQLCRTKAFEAAFRFMVPPYDKKLFINVNPNVLHDETFQKGLTKEYLNQYQISPSNIIFEITERNIIKDLKGFIATVSHYKSQDYRIAIDDAGAGYSGLNLISDVNPNYIKLDMKLIRNVDSDGLKAALVKGMVELSKISNIHLIAEGIETAEEMEALIVLGVQYGQGYYIQQPDCAVKEIRQEIITKIKNANSRKYDAITSSIFNTPIKNLCTVTETISPSELVPDVFDVFRHSPSCIGLCVLKDKIPAGIVTKERLALKLSGQYGFALYQNKPISHVMDRDFLSVDCDTPVNVVSSIAMSRELEKLYDFIVVTKNGEFFGTVTIRDLLRKTTEIEVAAAKHQNPLTGLPGNLIIEQKLHRCVFDGGPYSVAYFDIDNFKAYNDVYGFENGDMVLKLLANLLMENLDSGEFIGHIGGDDFVVIVGLHVEEDFFQRIVSVFEDEVLKYYSHDDVVKGYIMTANRRNQIEKFPLITLTVASVNNRFRGFKDVFELTEALAFMKKDKKMKLKILE
ncbi:GGDEF domain-containing protein [Anoxybacterium hadale]|uniref:GGDEF domain-containing protein n=1 Tax=Anoxybacterium hadale TaxID=3408580 RepID=A0ACD1AB31_9FIRM|nr:GGDEF domain-containing protein [Clostridiales bacterium]